MKKEYIIPSMLVVRMETQQMMAASLSISETASDTQMAPGMSDADAMEELLFH